MRISIQTVGTRGDVFPFIGLAQELARQGHETSVLASREYVNLITSYGIRAAVPFDFSVSEIMAGGTFRQCADWPFLFPFKMGSLVDGLLDAVLGRCIQAADGADLVISTAMLPPARLAAEARDARFMLVAFQPVLSPTRETPCALVTGRDLGSLGNKMSYLAIPALLSRFSAWFKASRRRLDLPSAEGPGCLATFKGRPLPKVTSIHGKLMSKPKDWSGESFIVSEWVPSLDGWMPPRALVEFLEDGDKPVYVGFGSMDASGTKNIGDLFGRHLQNGKRIIVSGSLASLVPDRAGLFKAGDVSHDWLFPRCSLVVHHGGAGTTAACLRADVPQEIRPHMLDQFWMAEAVRRGPVNGNASADPFEEALAFAMRS